MGVSALDFNTYKSTFACLITTTTRSKSLYKAHRKKKKSNGSGLSFRGGGGGEDKTKAQAFQTKALWKQACPLQKKLWTSQDRLSV